eukprot:SAG31_NODE_11452_length_1028_cov_1.413348_1_plen_93_part_00
MREAFLFLSTAVTADDAFIVRFYVRSVAGLPPHTTDRAQLQTLLQDSVGHRAVASGRRFWLCRDPATRWCGHVREKHHLLWPKYGSEQSEIG